jgi:holo-[acyl-carrier protein] synthase
MIHGIGIDITKVLRMKEVVDRWGERFLSRVFTKEEISYCYGKRDPFPSLSVRFAAKEAVIKALGFRVPFIDIEVVRGVHGKPSLCALGTLKAAFEEHSVGRTHLSLSHEKDYAMAFVVLEKDRS